MFVDGGIVVVVGMPLLSYAALAAVCVCVCLGACCLCPVVGQGARKASGISVDHGNI